ncbi:MAG: DNA polymerase III subunit [Acidobacteriota bacterium]
MPFRDLIGHTRLTTLLTRAVARESVPPTLLFSGPSGVGKWRAALALAEAINCQAPSHGDACGTCRSCDRIARGMHVDVRPVEPDDTGKIKIDAVRTALEGSGYRPFEGKRRVVLVRDTDAMLEAAQNSLLKMLEEPPPATMFVLTSAAPDSLLRTVRSRTMRLAFGRLTMAEVELLLVRDHEREPAEARRLAGLADGSVGAALALGSSDVAVTRDAALLLLSAAAERDLAGRLGLAKMVVGAKKPERTRQEMVAVLQLASSIVRDLAVLHAGSDRRLLANGDIADRLERLARALPASAARQAFAIIDRGLAALDRNAGPKLVAEWIAAEIYPDR